jgi:hypothetical protein
MGSSFLFDVQHSLQTKNDTKRTSGTPIPACLSPDRTGCALNAEQNARDGNGDGKQGFRSAVAEMRGKNPFQM